MGFQFQGRCSVSLRIGWSAADPREHVGQPSLRINVIQLAGLNNREHGCGSLSAAIGAGEQP
jgi:hypothetical protein